MQYDHINYARWGSIYLIEANQLPIEIEREFQQGNFVVKRSAAKFNQVDPDQSQEWLNATGKRDGGIVGITRTQSALSRWSLSYNMRSHIAAETRQLFQVGRDDSVTHKESSKGRVTADISVESSVLTTLQRFNILSTELHDVLQNSVTKDVATDDIQVFLLQAQQLGQTKLNSFVNERLVNR